MMTHREMVRASMYALQGKRVIARFSTHRDAVYAFNEYVRWLKDIRANDWTARKSVTPTVTFANSVGMVVFTSTVAHCERMDVDLFEDEFATGLEDVLR